MFICQLRWKRAGVVKGGSVSEGCERRERDGRSKGRDEESGRRRRRRRRRRRPEWSSVQED